MWRANKKGWLTRPTYNECVNDLFGPSVKKYLQDNQFPLNSLLAIENSPVHPIDLEETLLEEFNFITVKFVSTIIQLIQPV